MTSAAFRARPPVDGTLASIVAVFVDGRLVELHRLGRHDGGDGVLVDQLRLAVAAQQHAEIVEPAHHALQLDAVDQEDGEGRLGLADAVEEGVLQVLVSCRSAWGFASFSFGGQTPPTHGASWIGCPAPSP